MGEVDRFADLRVGFGDGLTGLGGHHFDQPVAVAQKRLAGSVQHAGALGAALLPPGGSGGDDRGDDLVEARRLVDARGTDGVDSELAAVDPGQDGAAPGPVRGQ